MSGLDKWIIFSVLFMASCSCSLVGLHLFLRRQSMFSDALSHSVLPGLVIAYMVTGSLASFPMLVGAICAGLVTAFLSEIFSSNRRVSSETSIGIVFSGLFAIGVFLLTAFARQAHIDTGCVLFGEVTLVALEEAYRNWHVGPLPVGLSLIRLFQTWVVIAIIFAALHKEFILAAFQPEVAKLQGLNVRLFHYLLMILASIAVVMSFEALGSVLVISFLVIPVAFGRLVARSFIRIYGAALLFSAVSIYVGIECASYADLNIGATVTSLQFVVFLIGFFLRSKIRTSVSLEHKLELERA